MAAKRLASGERKAQIARVAAELFAKRGFNGVTTREIAKRARVSESIVFRHFPTKDALYTEIINQKVHARPAIFDVGAAARGDDAEVFRSAARWFIRQVEEDNTFLRLMLYSALEDHDLASVCLKNRTDAIFGYLLNYVTRRMKEGAFRRMNPAIVIRSFLGMFFHFIMVEELFIIPKELEFSKEDAVRHYVDILLKGICA